MREGGWKHRFWAELHTRAVDFPRRIDSVASRSLTRYPRGLVAALHNRPSASRAQLEKQWLSDFAKRIPCKGCRRHWLSIVHRYPPRLTSRESYFRWTVAAHNGINRLLGKPVLKIVDAVRIWAASLN